MDIDNPRCPRSLGWLWFVLRYPKRQSPPGSRAAKPLQAGHKSESYQRFVYSQASSRPAWDTISLLGDARGATGCEPEAQAGKNHHHSSLTLQALQEKNNLHGVGSTATHRRLKGQAKTRQLLLPLGFIIAFTLQHALGALRGATLCPQLPASHRLDRATLAKCQV